LKTLKLKKNIYKKNFKNVDKMDAKMTVYYKNIRKSFLRLAKSRNLHSKGFLLLIVVFQTSFLSIQASLPFEIFEMESIADYYYCLACNADAMQMQSSNENSVRVSVYQMRAL